MKLHNVQIRDYPLLNKYFDFRELYDLLCSEDAYLFYEFCKLNLSCLRTTVVYHKVIGTWTPKGEAIPNTGLRYLTENPNQIMEEELGFGKKAFVPAETSDAGEVLVKLRDSNDFATMIMCWMQQTENKLAPKKEDWSLEAQSIKNAVTRLTKDGSRRFTVDAAVELYVYFLLHALAAVMPDKTESIEEMDAHLAQQCPATADTLSRERCVTLHAGADGKADIPLPYYTGESCKGDLLSIVEFKNMSKIAITARVKGTVLSRNIGPGKSVYALRKGNRFAAFLPRFRYSARIITSLWNRKLINCGVRQEEVNTDITYPVMWAHSEEYGQFIINQDGEMDTQTAWPNSIPTSPIVSVDGTAIDYCLLLEDGTFQSSIQKPGWKGRRLIAVRIGLNSAVAIDDGRRAVLANGKCIGKDVLEARTYNGHYILLSSTGEVTTDSGLQINETGYAVDVCPAGYIVALEDEIRHYTFENRLLAEWPVMNVTEVEADEKCVAYNDPDAGEVRVSELKKH